MINMVSTLLQVGYSGKAVNESLALGYAYVYRALKTGQGHVCEVVGKVLLLNKTLIFIAYYI